MNLLSLERVTRHIEAFLLSLHISKDLKPELIESFRQGGLRLLEFLLSERIEVKEAAEELNRLIEKFNQALALEAP